MYDTIIVGGGPAGLSAALVLGRCGRRILLYDAGRPRNARSPGLHGFLTRDGIRPTDLLRLGREELRPYGIDASSATVTGVRIFVAGDASRDVQFAIVAAAEGAKAAVAINKALQERAGLAVA